MVGLTLNFWGSCRSRRSSGSRCCSLGMLSQRRRSMPLTNSSRLYSHMVAALKCQLSTSITMSPGSTWIRMPHQYNG